VSLPLPLGNIIGGGAHAMGPTPDMQEHLVLPVSAASLKEAVALNIQVHNETGRLLAKRDDRFTGGSDDERAWAADLDDTEALELLQEAARAVGSETGARFRLGLDLERTVRRNVPWGRHATPCASAEASRLRAADRSSSKTGQAAASNASTS